VKLRQEAFPLQLTIIVVSLATHGVA